MAGPGRRAGHHGLMTARRSIPGIGWPAAALMAGAAALRLLPRDYHRFQIAVEGTRETWLGSAPVLAALCALARRPALSVAFGALSVELIRTADLPGRPLAGNRPPRVLLGRGNAAARDAPVRPSGIAPQSGGFRLVTANLLLVNRQIPRLTSELLADDADVIVLQELTSAHLAAMRDAGLLQRFNHQVLDPRPGWDGSAVLSRWPLRDARVLDLAGATMCAAEVITPDGPVHVVAVHAMNPAGRGQLAPWRRQHELLAEHLAAQTVPVVLAGDFNATVHQRALRTLLAAGLRDAFAEPTSAARRPCRPRRPTALSGMTWPRWRSPVVPVMRLDHVLVSGRVGVRRLRAAVSSGSDHKRLVADLWLR